MASEEPFCEILLNTLVTWPDAMFLNTHLHPLLQVTLPGRSTWEATQAQDSASALQKDHLKN